MGNWMSMFVTASGRGCRAAGLENGVDDVVAWEGTPRGVLSPLVVSPDLETRHSPPTPPPSPSSPFPLPTPESPLQPGLPFSLARQTLPQSLCTPFHDSPPAAFEYSPPSWWWFGVHVCICAVSPAIVMPSIASPAIATPSIVSPAIAMPSIASPVIATPSIRPRPQLRWRRRCSTQGCPIQNGHFL